MRNLRQHDVLWVASRCQTKATRTSTSCPRAPTSSISSATATGRQAGNYEDGFAVYPSDSVNVRVKWDSWSGTPQNFDLVIFDQSGQVVATSQRQQSGGATPVEAVVVTNPDTNLGDPPSIYYAAIRRTAASVNPRFDTYMIHTTSELVDPSGSISAPADSPYTFAIGAACVSDGALEPFSKSGPDDRRSGQARSCGSGRDNRADQSEHHAVRAGHRPLSHRHELLGFRRHLRRRTARRRRSGGVEERRSGTQRGPDATRAQGLASDPTGSGPDNALGWGRLTMHARASGGPSEASVSIFAKQFRPRFGQCLVAALGWDVDSGSVASSLRPLM